MDVIPSKQNIDALKVGVFWYVCPLESFKKKKKKCSSHRINMVLMNWTMG
jgi:hypothetical protein